MMPQPQPTTGNPGPSATTRNPGNPVTAKVKQDTDAKMQSLGPQRADDYQKIIVAAMRILYSPQTHKFEVAAMQKIAGPQDVPQVVAQGVVKLMLLIYKESGKKM